LLGAGWLVAGVAGCWVLSVGSGLLDHWLLGAGMMDYWLKDVASKGSEQPICNPSNLAIKQSSIQHPASVINGLNFIKYTCI
jgi:hypothetical protein